MQNMKFSADILNELILKKNNRTVMGLDPKLEYIPAHIREQALKDCGGDVRRAAEEAIYRFVTGLIDCAADYVAAVKPQCAFYEMYGLPGVTALHRIIDYAKDAGLYVILDGKRNDIGSTAEAYAAAAIGTTDFFGTPVAATGADAVTVNPYLGVDGVAPFVKTAAEQCGALYVLVKTSNPSSSQLQDLDCGGATLFEKVGSLVEEWGAPYIGEHGYSPVGAVIGATHPEQLTYLRGKMPHTMFLIPGYGAQGGGAKDVVGGFDTKGLGAVVNNSRGLMCAYQKAGDDGTNYQKITRDAVIAMRDDINSALGL